MRDGTLIGALRELERSTNRKLQVLHMEVGDRTGRLLDRYHLMHVAKLYYHLDWLEARLRWFERPWWSRWWNRLRGFRPQPKPDIDAIVMEQLQAWDEEHMSTRCEARAPETGEQCHFETGHEGNHQGVRKVRVVGSPGTVEWEDEPEPVEAS